jgi:two-component system sensor histidine kinase YesM
MAKYLNWGLKLYHLFRSVSILWKLLFWHLILSGIVVIISCYFTYFTLTDVLNGRIIQSEMKALTEANNKAAFLLGDLENISDKIYLNKEVRALLLASSFNNQDHRSLDSLFGSYKFFHTWMKYNAFILGYNGYRYRYSSVSSSETDLIFEDIKDAEWFKSIFTLRGRIMLINGLRTKIKGLEKKILFTRAIIDFTSGRHLGIFVIIFEKEVLNHIYQTLTQNNYSSLYIIDNQDQLITNTLAEDMKNFVIPTAGQKKNNSSMFLPDTNTQVLFSHIERTDWTLVEILELNNLYSFMGHIRSLLIIVSLIDIAAALFISYLILKQIYDPVQKLQSAMYEIQKGNFSIKDLDINRPDEIGRLNHGLVRMAEALDVSFRNLYKEQHDKRVAEIKMLQAQIKPHFLYNTLGSIRGLVGMGMNEEAERMIISLVKLLKNTFSMAEMVTVSEEIDNLSNYCVIYRYRYLKFDFFCDIARPVMNAAIPKLIIQPLVENAIIHNLNYSNDLRIEVSAYNIDSRLVIVVDDNGRGINNETREKLFDENGRIKAQSDSKGLKNVQDRIILQFGYAYGLYIDVKESRGARLRLEMPL